MLQNLAWWDSNPHAAALESLLTSNEEAHAAYSQPGQPHMDISRLCRDGRQEAYMGGVAGATLDQLEVGTKGTHAEYHDHT